MQTTLQRWAVLIGINGYHESLGRLKYSVNDCRRLAEVLTTGTGPVARQASARFGDSAPKGLWRVALSKEK